jgi:kumamolisin
MLPKGTYHHLSLFSALRITAVAALATTFTIASAQVDVRPPDHTPIAGRDSSDATTGKKPTVVPGKLIIPTSSQTLATDKGQRAHTNVRYIVPAVASPLEAPPYSGYAYETPASLACLYSLVTTISGCNPNSTTNTPSGGSETIAIVDAYDDPSIYADLAYFSDQFGIPFATNQFQVIYASGTEPSVDISGGWEMEESLDVEMVHAMAPKAKIYLVEAASNYYSDLFIAVQVATNLVRCGSSSSSSTACSSTATGKGEVSMSWGGEEFSSETSYDSYFTGANVVYLASAGDSPGVIWPSASPNVISAGGTTTARSLSTGNFIQEVTWQDGGGGLSLYEAIPSYQSSISSIAGKARATPDISSDANPNTGIWIYNSYQADLDSLEGESGASGWYIVGGTSAAAPLWAGVLNSAATKAGAFPASSKAELTTIYTTLGSATNYPADFNDITYGDCNYYGSTFAAKGYDLCTGVGSPKGLSGK